MTDRADEIARKLWDECGNIHGIGAGYNQIAAIAAALRSYRNEGLEEAAECVEFARNCRGVRTILILNDVALSVRSLKSKEPQG